MTQKPRFIGRREPYTDIGIRRVPCARCGEPSSAQWNACANGGRYVGICSPCDVGLNKLALDYMRVPAADDLLAAYTGARAA